jgi:hypothetical protein
MRMPYQALARLGVLIGQEANDWVLWQNVQFTPSALDTWTITA